MHEGYVANIKALAPALSAQGVDWLGQAVDALCSRAGVLFPALGLFSPGKR
jgi:hypothetical protein